MIMIACRGPAAANALSVGKCPSPAIDHSGDQQASEFVDTVGGDPGHGYPAEPAQGRLQSGKVAEAGQRADRPSRSDYVGLASTILDEQGAGMALEAIPDHIAKSGRFGEHDPPFRIVQGGRRVAPGQVLIHDYSAPQMNLQE